MSCDIILQLEEEIQTADKEIAEALQLERKLKGNFDEDRYMMSKEDSMDPWDRWEADKYSQYLRGDLKSYQKQIRVRMKLEKKKRLLEKKLFKQKKMKEQMGDPQIDN